MGEQQGSQPGKWVSDGGRLRWVSSEELRMENLETYGDEGFGNDLEDLDEEIWASDHLSLPPGAPESARIRAALAWLDRQRMQTQESINEQALLLYQQQRQHEEAPRTRRRRPEPPSPIAITSAELNGALDWFEAATIELRDLAERSSGRALVEWYLWISAAPPIPIHEDQETIANARSHGQSHARERTRQHTEQLTLPDMDED